MTCDEFLAQHSEYVDDRLRLPEVARMRRHVRECESCARYDRVIAHGRRALRELPYAEPSSAFYAGLRARLAAAEYASVAASSSVATAARRAGPGSLATLSIAALIATVAWSALLRPEAPTIELPPMVAQAPASRAGWSLFMPTPRFAPRSGWASSGWWGDAVPGARYPTSARTTATVPLWSDARMMSPALLGADTVALGRSFVRPAFD